MTTGPYATTATRHSIRRCGGVYLGLAVGRLADYCSTICTWANNPQMEIVRGTFCPSGAPDDLGILRNQMFLDRPLGVSTLSLVGLGRPLIDYQRVFRPRLQRTPAQRSRTVNAPCCFYRPSLFLTTSAMLTFQIFSMCGSGVAYARFSRSSPPHSPFRKLRN